MADARPGKTPRDEPTDEDEDVAMTTTAVPADEDAAPPAAKRAKPHFDKLTNLVVKRMHTYFASYAKKKKTTTKTPEPEDPDATDVEDEDDDVAAAAAAAAAAASTKPKKAKRVASETELSFRRDGKEALGEYARQTLESLATMVAKWSSTLAIDPIHVFHVMSMDSRREDAVHLLEDAMLLHSLAWKAGMKPNSSTVQLSDIRKELPFLFPNVFVKQALQNAVKATEAPSAKTPCALALSVAMTVILIKVCSRAKKRAVAKGHVQLTAEDVHECAIHFDEDYIIGKMPLEGFFLSE